MSDTPDTASHHEPENEIVAAAAAAKARAEAAARTVAEKTKRWPLAKIGLAASIGSAAIAAAVLYSNRDDTGSKK
jgi:negative regulator of sigma E activity